MATAVEMTIVLGRTLYGAPQGTPDSDDTIENETIEGCETRVSVTWRLMEGEQNLPLTASLLAEKTVQVLETADRAIRCKTQTPTTQIPEKTERLPIAQPIRVPAPEVPPANEATSTGTTAPACAAAGNGASSVSTSNGNGANGNEANGNGTATRSFTTAYVPRITNAQRLAIQSLCTRHGIADWELRRLVWEQFGKKEQSELTKDQAGELLNLLQQNTACDGAHDHAYA